LTPQGPPKQSKNKLPASKGKRASSNEKTSPVESSDLEQAESRKGKIGCASNDRVKTKSQFNVSIEKNGMRRTSENTRQKPQTGINGRGQEKT